MQPELVTLVEGQEGTDMGFFHVVPGGCGDLARAEQIVFQCQWGRGLLWFLFQTGVLSVGRCSHLCQDSAFQKPLFPHSYGSMTIY